MGLTRAKLIASYASKNAPPVIEVMFNPSELTIDPVAFSPVLLVDPAGRVSRFPRALCRYRAADGRAGVGWTEWNQPQD